MRNSSTELHLKGSTNIIDRFCLKKKKEEKKPLVQGSFNKPFANVQIKYRLKTINQLFLLRIYGDIAKNVIFLLTFIYSLRNTWDQNVMCSSQIKKKKTNMFHQLIALVIQL